MPSPDLHSHCLLTAEPLSLQIAVDFVSTPASGGIATFIGTARTKSATGSMSDVVRLEYEAYESMALETLERIAAECLAAFALDRIAVLHRTGTVAIGDAAIIVAVSAKHRAAAFDACRHAVESVKATLPVWKKEVFADGTHWVGSGA